MCYLYIQVGVKSLVCGELIMCYLYIQVGVKSLVCGELIMCYLYIQVGVKSLETGVWGAYQNVLTNLDQVTDDDYRKKV